MNEEGRKHYDEINELLVSNCSYRKLSEHEISDIVKTVQAKQQKILDRKYVSEEDLRSVVLHPIFPHPYFQRAFKTGDN